MQRQLRCQHRSNWGQRFSLIERVYRDISGGMSASGQTLSVSMIQTRFQCASPYSLLLSV